MFVGVGVLAPVAGVFHLVTHAFFKALLFLASGVVMHAMAGELDMRKMSGLKRVLPKTRWLMLIGCLALAGVPASAGFFSKDEIIAAAWDAEPRCSALMLLFTAFLTAYYTFRLYFRVFEGPRGHPAAAGRTRHGARTSTSIDAHDDGACTTRCARPRRAWLTAITRHHNHEPAIMILPLVVLAIGAIAGGLPELARSTQPRRISSAKARRSRMAYRPGVSTRRRVTRWRSGSMRCGAAEADRRSRATPSTRCTSR